MTFSLLNLVFRVASRSMKRMARVCNLILVAGLIGLGFAGCKLPARNTGNEYEMAVFGQSATGGVRLTIQIQVPRASNQSVWIDREPLFWVSEGLQRAELVVDKQGTEILRLWLTTAGSRQFEGVTSRYLQRNLFFLYPLPDPMQKGKFKTCCVGTYRVEGIVAARVLDMIPDASHTELEFIVEELNLKAGAQ